MIEKYETKQGEIWELMTLSELLLGVPKIDSWGKRHHLASSCLIPLTPYPTTVCRYFKEEEKRRKSEQHQPELKADIDFLTRAARGASGLLRGRGWKGQEEMRKGGKGWEESPCWLRICGSIYWSEEQKKNPKPILAWGSGYYED